MVELVAGHDPTILMNAVRAGPTESATETESQVAKFQRYEDDVEDAVAVAVAVAVAADGVGGRKWTAVADASPGWARRLRRPNEVV